jgi:hypothetical protein
MPPRLIDAQPTEYSQLPKGGGYFIQFRELVIWQRFNAIILTPTEPRYVIFMVELSEAGLPQFKVEKQRPLTPEETAHFTTLVKAAERKAKSERQQQQRSDLAQQHQKAIAEVTGGRVLM